MPRSKHGQYDQESHLPNNEGQAVGSGLTVWFHAHIRECLGEEAGQALIQASRKPGGKSGGQNMAWLCAQLCEQGHTDLAEAYQQRRRAEEAKARIEKKRRQIATCEATIARNDTPPEHQAWLRKEIEKMRIYLEKHGYAD